MLKEEEIEEEEEKINIMIYFLLGHKDIIITFEPQHCVSTTILLYIQYSSSGRCCPAGCQPELGI
jgi:hypothetical protein